MIPIPSNPNLPHPLNPLNNFLPLFPFLPLLPLLPLLPVYLLSLLSLLFLLLLDCIGLLLGGGVTAGEICLCLLWGRRVVVLGYGFDWGWS